MNLYLYILKLFINNKEYYNKYIEYIDLEFLRINYSDILKLFLSLKKLHEKDSKATTLVDFEAVFFTNYPNADKELFSAIFRDIEASTADEGRIEEYLNSLKGRVDASRIAFIALDVAEGRASVEALHDATESYRKAPKVVSSEIEWVSDDIEELYKTAIGEGGLNWRLKSLNQSLGPLRKGDFGFIFARPETGKTTFLASETSFMAQQANTCVLWFNNEEQHEKVAIRMYQAALGARLEQVTANMPRAREAFYERTQRRLRMPKLEAFTRKDVERICEQTKPSLIVIDQLDKVNGFDGEREDLRMGTIYQWARELAKKYAPVIGVSQSDASGEGVKYLHMGNVANAKTAKQAEADWILGIGLDYNEHPNIRGFSICKNKLIGGDQSIPKLRHGKWDVLIDPEVARYKDMVMER